MAKKLVQNITAREEDFAQWYTDVVREAKLCDYSGVKGCMNYLPNGYALWENIQKNLDARFKETGVENVYLPVMIPERKGSYRRICTGSCMGNTWWTGRTSGKILYPSYI